MEGVVGGAKNPPFDDKSKKPYLNRQWSPTRHTALLGNEKLNWVWLGSHAANQ